MKFGNFEIDSDTLVVLVWIIVIAIIVLFNK